MESRCRKAYGLMTASVLVPNKSIFDKPVGKLKPGAWLAVFGLEKLKMLFGCV
jgi:hypothetical protein